VSCKSCGGDTGGSPTYEFAAIDAEAIEVRHLNGSFADGFDAADAENEN